MEVAPLPALDYCDMAPSPLASIPQSRFWFRGSASFAEDLSYYEVHDAVTIPSWQRRFLVIDGVLRNVAWAGRGIAFAFLLAVCVAMGRFAPALALVAGHLLFVHLGFLATLRVLRSRVPARSLRRPWHAGVHPSRLVAAFAVASFVLVIRSLGPFLEALTMWLRPAAVVREWKAPRA
jgi:hypothetical protein